MKNILLKTFNILLVLVILASCSPKYTTSFNTTSDFYAQKTESKVVGDEVTTNDNELSLALTSKSSIEGDTNNDMTLAPSSDELLVNNDEKTVPAEITSLNKRVTEFSSKIERLKAEGVDDEHLKKEIRAEGKKFKQELKNRIKTMKREEAGANDYTLMMVLAFFIPFLAVGLVYGIGTEFWISLILTIIFWLPGAIYALIKVNQHFKG